MVFLFKKLFLKNSNLFGNKNYLNILDSYSARTIKKKKRMDSKLLIHSRILVDSRTKIFSRVVLKLIFDYDLDFLYNCIVLIQTPFFSLKRQNELTMAGTEPRTDTTKLVGPQFSPVSIWQSMNSLKGTRFLAGIPKRLAMARPPARCP